MFVLLFCLLKRYMCFKRFRAQRWFVQLLFSKMLAHGFTFISATGEALIHERCFNLCRLVEMAIWGSSCTFRFLNLNSSRTRAYKKISTNSQQHHTVQVNPRSRRTTHTKNTEYQERQIAVTPNNSKTKYQQHQIRTCAKRQFAQHPVA